jgi:hypothetical protein
MKLLLALLFVTPAFAQTYDFAAAPAGCAACGGEDGSFDYNAGAITNFNWNYQWTPQSVIGNTFSFVNPLGDTLSMSLFTPLGGQSATGSDFTIRYAGGGDYGYCQGTGLCDQGPMVYTAVNKVSQFSASQAPEIGGAGAPTALTLLFGALAVITGLRPRPSP